MNSPDEPEDYASAKTALNEALNEAIGTTPLIHSESKEEAALKAYYIYSHIMPFPRYSSTAARMLLEALAEVTDLKTYHIAENRDINLEAMVRNWSDFKHEHEKGKFWDKKATPSDILKWQKQAMEKKEDTGIASTLKDYVNDAIYAESMGDKAEIFSTRRAILKELLDRTKNPASDEDKADDEKIKPLLGEYADLEETKRWLKNPITLHVGMVEYEDAQGQHKKARGMQFGCSNFDESDIDFHKLFLQVHVHESFPKGSNDAFMEIRQKLQEPDTVLTEEGTLVKGKIRPFNEEKLGKVKREFEAQKRKSKDGYIYGVPSETGSFRG